jgi:catechol 2,3-dioxygenase-like lactoylglutathione lyase family enzyme
MAKQEIDPIVQIALVVDDIEKYIDAYTEVFGIERPAWRLTDTKDVTHARYLGRETEARAKLAFIKAGNLSIELIEPVGEPSVWATALKQNGPGVHHIAFRYKDKKPVLDALGLPITQTGDFKGGNYTYLDARGKLGVDIEILENPDM